MQLFLAAAMSELVSACAVRRHVGGGPAVLLCSLGLVREQELFKQQVLALGHYWDRVEFLDPAIGNGVGDLSKGPLSRFFGDLAASRQHVELIRAKLKQVLGHETLACGGRGLSLYFNLLHHYVLHVLGLLPRARRICYPHGLDQPRRFQLQHQSHYYRPRGWRTMWSTIAAQSGFVRKGYFGIALGLRLTGRSRLPLPFDGVDHAVVFSPAVPPVSHDRVPRETLVATLRDVTTAHGIREQLAPLFAVLDLSRTAIVLLPELDVQHPNLNSDRALDELIAALARHAQVDTILLKPHPRSRYAEYAGWLECQRARRSDLELLPWPASAAGTLTELVAALWPVRCVGSFGSCALPPWASFGVPHYALLSAAQTYDSGWPRAGQAAKYLSTRGAVELLRDEGLLQTLD